MKKIKKQSPLKINLSLEVVKKQKDGFHQIRMLVAKLPILSDVLIFEIEDVARLENEVLIECDCEGFPLDDSNLIWKVANAFMQKIGRSFKIKVFVDKNIPMAGGLGGGSSNAATTLLVLNEYCDNVLSMNDLRTLAVSIGKDIPLFLFDENVLYLDNLGDNLVGSLDFKFKNILFINPNINVSTGESYEKLKERISFMENQDRINLSEKLFDILKKGDDFYSCLYNDFEIVVESEYPIIKEVKSALRVFGAKTSLMSGSGPTVFGLFESKKELLIAKENLKKVYPDFLIF